MSVFVVIFLSAVRILSLVPFKTTFGLSLCFSSWEFSWFFSINDARKLEFFIQAVLQVSSSEFLSQPTENLLFFLCILVNSILGSLPWCHSNVFTFNRVCKVNRRTHTGRSPLTVKRNLFSKIAITKSLRFCIDSYTSPYGSEALVGYFLPQSYLTKVFLYLGCKCALPVWFFGSNSITALFSNATSCQERSNKSLKLEKISITRWFLVVGNAKFTIQHCPIKPFSYVTVFQNHQNSNCVFFRFFSLGVRNLVQSITWLTRNFCRIFWVISQYFSFTIGWFLENCIILFTSVSRTPTNFCLSLFFSPVMFVFSSLGSESPPPHQLSLRCPKNESKSEQTTLSLSLLSGVGGTQTLRFSFW